MEEVEPYYHTPFCDYLRIDWAEKLARRGIEFESLVRYGMDCDVLYFEFEDGFLCLDSDDDTVDTSFDESCLGDCLKTYTYEQLCRELPIAVRKPNNPTIWYGLSTRYIKHDLFGKGVVGFVIEYAPVGVPATQEQPEPFSTAHVDGKVAAAMMLVKLKEEGWVAV